MGDTSPSTRPPASPQHNSRPPADGGPQAASWTRLRAAEETAPAEVPKPFTTPPGYKPPSLGEQWLYATRRHPYYRYGYGAVVVTGALLYWAATAEKKGHAEDGGVRGRG